MDLNGHYYSDLIHYFLFSCGILFHPRVLQLGYFEDLREMERLWLMFLKNYSVLWLIFFFQLAAHNTHTHKPGLHLPFFEM